MAAGETTVLSLFSERDAGPWTPRSNCGQGAGRNRQGEAAGGTARGPPRPFSHSHPEDVFWTYFQLYFDQISSFLDNFEPNFLNFSHF